MEKRSIDDWLPSIDLLTKTVEKVIFCIQGSYMPLQRQQNQKDNSCSQAITLEEAINKRKEKLKYYKKLLSSCQNSMKTKLQISQADIFKKMDDVDAQIANMNQILRFLNEQTGLNECIHNINDQIDKYNQKFSLLTNEIQKAEVELKKQAKVHSEYESYASKIQHLIEKKKKIMKKRHQIAHQLSGVNQNSVIHIPAYKQNIKMKNALKGSISKLRMRITNFDREIADTEKQKNEIQALIRDTQNQYIDLKKFTNETISKTTQKSYFTTNVVDEIKKLIKIRRDRSELNKKIKIEKQHYFGFQSEINRINSKIEGLKMEKKKLINEECAIEDNFLKKAMPKKKSRKRSKSVNKILLLNNNINGSDYSNNDLINGDDFDHEKNINQKKNIKEMEKNNLKLLKSVESENAKIISLRQKIRELQENIIFQVKLKKEKESLKKERENHSIFFSFEKIQNQIEEKKNNIERLKQKIKEEKEFLRLYSQIDINDSDF